MVSRFERQLKHQYVFAYLQHTNYLFPYLDSTESMPSQATGTGDVETRRSSDPYYLERTLFVKGLVARDRSRLNDARELWGNLLKIKTQRCKDTDAEAVALNNLGILMLEMSKLDAKKVRDAYSLTQRAVEVMQVYSHYVTNPLVREDKEVMELIQVSKV